MRNSVSVSPRTKDFQSEWHSLFDVQRWQFEDAQRDVRTPYYLEDRDNLLEAQRCERENLRIRQVAALEDAHAEERMCARLDGQTPGRLAKLSGKHADEMAALKQLQKEDESEFQREMANLVQNEDEHMAKELEEMEEMALL